MSTQIVQHKSRDFDVVLNFPSTENTLSWSFTAENDGEIYAVDLVNVVSYQIAGAPVTLPYAVTAGASYSVTIVKQTNGQPASISFNTRRAVNKAVTISVPDFNIERRYIYLIDVAERLIKVDTRLLVSTNYVGAGQWTTTPVEAAYQIPAIADVKWHAFHPIYRNNYEEVIIVGVELRGLKRTAILTFDVTTLKFYNISKTLENEPTFIYISIPYYYCSGVYDYVNNVLQFSSVSGPASVYALQIDLTTSSVSMFNNNQNKKVISTNNDVTNINNSKISNFYLNPVTGRFAGFNTYFSIAPYKSYNLIDFFQDQFAKLFNIKDGLVYLPNQGGGIVSFRKYDGNGVYVSAIAPAAVSGFPNSVFVDYDNIRYIYSVSYTNLSVGFINLQTLAVASTTSPSDVEIGTTSWHNLEACNYFGGGVAISNKGITYPDILTNRANKRLHIFEPNFTNGTVITRYLDFDNALLMLRANGIQ